MAQAGREHSRPLAMAKKVTNVGSARVMGDTLGSRTKAQEPKKGAHHRPETEKLRHASPSPRPPIGPQQGESKQHETSRRERGHDGARIGSSHKK